MDATCQIEIPPTFVALFQKNRHVPIPAHQQREILERYELCEDLAQGLSERGRCFLLELRITSDDVLERFAQELPALEALALSQAEQVWTLRRCAEISDWCN